MASLITVDIKEAIFRDHDDFFFSLGHAREPTIGDQHITGGDICRQYAHVFFPFPFGFDVLVLPCFRSQSACLSISFFQSRLLALTKPTTTLPSLSRESRRT